jgi:hypothetical protein
LFVAVSRIAPTKSDLAIGQGDQAVVGDGHAMGVAAEIVHYVFRATEGRLQVHLSFAKSLSPPTLRGFLPVWRKLFGLGLQADSPTRRKMLAEDMNRPRAGLQAKAFGHQKMALESTLPPHNDGVARRVSERIESCFHAQSEFL